MAMRKRGSVEWAPGFILEPPGPPPPLPKRRRPVPGRRARKLAAKSSWTREFREVVGLLASDRGGLESMSVAQQMLARRAAALEVELRRFEAKFSKRPDDESMASRTMLYHYQRALNSQRRLLEALGLRRVPRPVQMDGAEILPPDQVREEVQRRAREELSDNMLSLLFRANVRERMADPEAVVRPIIITALPPPDAPPDFEEVPGDD
jgi:hypothetical protein